MLATMRACKQSIPMGGRPPHHIDEEGAPGEVHDAGAQGEGGTPDQAAHEGPQEEGGAVGQGEPQGRARIISARAVAAHHVRGRR